MKLLRRSAPRNDRKARNSKVSYKVFARIFGPPACRIKELPAEIILDSTAKGATVCCLYRNIKNICSRKDGNVEACCQWKKSINYRETVLGYGCPQRSESVGR